MLKTRKASNESRTVRVGNREVDRSLLRWRVRNPAGPGACIACCCRSGVYMSLRERDRVLAHADAVRREMDGDQVSDPRRWFGTRVYRDPDFDGGRCVGTQVHRGRCVFLNARGLCTLQLATARVGGPQLKPFYCRIFPLTVEDGVVEYDDLCEGGAGCCSFGTRGARPVVESCRPELEEVLGPEGYVSLLRLTARGSPQDMDGDAAGARPVELRQEDSLPRS